MKRYLLAGTLIFAALLVSCKKEEDKKEYFDGSGEFTINSKFYSTFYFLPLEEISVEFDPSGIVVPSEGITYNWTFSGFYYEGQLIDTLHNGPTSIKLTTPEQYGTYSITIQPLHDDYYTPTPPILSVVVIDPESKESFRGYADGEFSFIDERDGVEYPYSRFGDLFWFITNLRWKTAGVSVDSIAAFDYIFGRLYIWEEATGGESREGLGNGPQGVCPTGWSIPTNEDWSNLASYVLGVPTPFEDNWAGMGEMASAPFYLNDTRLWNVLSPDNLHSNTMQWNAIPAGNHTPGNLLLPFQNRDSFGFWWSSSEYSANNANYRFIHYNDNLFRYANGNKVNLGISVRCVKLATQP